MIVLGVFGSTIFSASCYYVCEFLDQKLKKDAGTLRSML